MKYRRILLTVLITVVLILSVFGLYRRSDTKDTEITEDFVTGEIPEKDREPPDDFRTATFGVWCFWGPDARVGVADGVIRTRVGYQEVKNSTRDDSETKMEAIQIDYDTEKISYNELYEMISETGQHRELHPFGEFIWPESMTKVTVLNDTKLLRRVIKRSIPT
ncbi:MAG: peptide-methionine (S)-S-oxide reductase [Candidatus Thermoplasmatota archaeon]